MLHENQKQYSLLESEFYGIRDRYEDMKSERMQEIDKIQTINSKYVNIVNDHNPLTNQFTSSLIKPNPLTASAS